MRIVMVCLGNICRSPLAEGILRKLVNESGLGWEVDSAGTSGWHDGELPDPRSIEIADHYGIDITGQRSRMFTQQDFEQFDLIIAMDAKNYQDILSKSLNPKKDQAKVKLLLDYSYPGEHRGVPDPYFEGGFDQVYQMIYQACLQLIKQEKNKIL